MTCDEAREAAPELAAGTLPGDERAAVLAHVAECAGCQDEVARLAAAVDAAVLAMAPPADPPPGFESRVVAAVSGARPTRRRLGPLAAAAVVALVVGLGAGWWMGRAGSGDDAERPQVAALQAKDGRPVGHAILAGDWVVVDVDGLYARGGQDEAASYTVELDVGGGRRAAAGTVAVTEGRGTARVRAPEGTVGVHLVSLDGAYECKAVFTGA